MNNMENIKNIIKEYPNIKKNYNIKTYSDLNKNFNMLILNKKGDIFDQITFCYKNEKRLKEHLKEINNYK